MNARARIVTEARSLIGVPFRHRGRTRDGLDCAGVIAYVRRMALGASDDFTSYTETPTEETVARELGRVAMAIPPEEARPGDVVVLRFNGAATHLGILTRDAVIHADRVDGGVVEIRAEIARRLIASHHRLNGVQP